MSQQPGTRVPLSRLTLEHPMSLQVFDDYEAAQRCVDVLSDAEFPVENLLIVGTDLKQIERVTGRLTMGRVALSGALSGAWIGLFFGALFYFFSTGANQLASLVTAIVGGALFGMVWAALAYRLTGGARDFTSVSQVVATRYEVLVEHRNMAQARELLARGPGAPVAAPSTPYPGEPAGGASVPPPADQAPAWGATPPASPAPPKYRTYGEAQDAERARHGEGHEQG